MKRLLTGLFILLMVGRVYGAPSNSVSIPTSFTAGTTAVASEVNDDFNHISTQYNAHTHTDITQVGTITSGVWSGTAIAISAGGTGQTTATAAFDALAPTTTNGDIIYYNGTDNIRLAIGAYNTILSSNGTTPSYGLTASTAAGASRLYISGSDNYLPDATVDTTALKTTTSTAGTTTNGENMTMTGGSYSFYPQVTGNMDEAKIALSFNPGALTTNIWMDAATGTVTWQNRYITASGQDFWVFLKLDKSTNEIISSSAASDHPSYGNGGDPVIIAHPFRDYDEATQQIVLLDKSSANQIKKESEDTGKLIPNLLDEEYKVGNQDLPYKPLHSGQFIDQKPVLIENIPNYIKVRALIKLSQAEKNQREQKRQQAKQKYEQDKVKKSQDKQKAIEKLKVLGLSEDEVKALN